MKCGRSGKSGGLRLARDPLALLGPLETEVENGGDTPLAGLESLSRRSGFRSGSRRSVIHGQSGLWRPIRPEQAHHPIIDREMQSGRIAARGGAHVWSCPRRWSRKQDGRSPVWSCQLSRASRRRAGPEAQRGWRSPAWPSDP